MNTQYRKEDLGLIVKALMIAIDHTPQGLEKSIQFKDLLNKTFKLRIELVSNDMIDNIFPEKGTGDTP